MNFTVDIAREEHVALAAQVSALIDEAAKARGIGLARRAPEYVARKIREGKAVIALSDSGELAGFCYIETWQHGRYVAHSGLIVAPAFRHCGLARSVKRRVFELSLEKYPEAKVFGITTSLAVMRINTGLGYEPVTFSELTTDDAFWEGCATCPHYDVLQRTARTVCLCTGMLYDPRRGGGAPR